ncbi:DUF5615 family PIN-like protein [candidate division KSB1 bacterium]|nr:DUF5615 family PIN-like protein [candidate division KSB1 bacterium]
MKVLLDECVPRPLKFDLIGHDVDHVTEMGWSGIKNGKLLGLAVNAGFEVLVTTDQNLQYQQNLQNFEIGILVLIAKSNRIDDLQPLVPEALNVMRGITASQLVEVRP